VLSRGTHARLQQHKRDGRIKAECCHASWGILVAFVIERGQRLHQLGARHARQDHFVDVAALGGDIRAGKPLAELRDLFSAHRRRIGGLLDVALVEDVDRALRAHHRDLGARPRVVEIGANVLLDMTQ
jgi:hypothetical protein